MALRNTLRRLEGKAYAERGRIRLRDGGVFYFNRERASEQLWVYALGRMLRSDEEDNPPEILRAIRNSKNPRKEIENFRPPNPQVALVDPLFLVQDAHEDAL